MAKDQRGRRAATDALVKPSGRAAPAAKGRTSDAWLAAVVFGTPEPKIPVNIRLDADIVHYFRGGGPGYQTRINDVLRAFVTARLRTGDAPGAPRKPPRKALAKARPG